MAMRDFFSWSDDFQGPRVFTAGALDSTGMWFYTDTSAAGAPTCAVVDGAPEAGEVKLTMASTSEIENLCLSNNDILWIPITRLQRFATRLKFVAGAGGVIDTTTSWAVGLIGDRNDAIDSIAQNIIFRGIGSTAIVVETDDGTTDLDDKATGRLMSDNVYHDFEIDFSKGLGDIRFFIDGTPVATGTTFTMAAYTGALQLFLQLQKTADTNVDAVVWDYVYVEGRRVVTRPA